MIKEKAGTANHPKAEALSSASSAPWKTVLDAHAGTDEQAHLADGHKHFGAGEFKQSLIAFEDAYRCRFDSTILFHIAECQRYIGNQRAARRSYENYLKNTLNPDKEATTAVRLAELDELDALDGRGPSWLRKIFRNA